MNVESPTPPPDRVSLAGDVVRPPDDVLPGQLPHLPSGWFRRQIVLRLAAAALCVGATAIIATGPPWPVGDQSARAHASASATGQVTRTDPVGGGDDRVTVAWTDEVGNPHTSTFALDLRPRYEVGEPFALRYDPEDPDSPAVMADASLSNNLDIIYEQSMIPAALALIALGAAGQGMLRRRWIRKALARGIILSWQGVDDVIPHVPGSGNAWDLPETHRAWWRGIQSAGGYLVGNVLIGGFAFVAKIWAGNWIDTLVAAAVGFSALGAIYAVVRGRLWWLLRSRPWQTWHGTPARPSNRRRRAVIRVNGLQPDGGTATALLRASRWGAEQVAPLGTFGPLLVLRGGDRLALVAAPEQDAQIRVARLPRTVRQHERWAGTFDEWLPSPRDG